MKLKTADLKEFQKRTTHIEDNASKPILQYILLEIKDGIGSLTKTNLAYYCKYEFPCTEQDIRILLEEKPIMQFVNMIDDEFINMNIEAENIILGEKGKQISISTQPHEDYPKFPINESPKETVINQEILSSLALAQFYADERPTNFSYVYFNGEDIFGSNNHIMYFQNFADKVQGLPDLKIKPTACKILSMFSEVTHHNNNTIDFFTTNGSDYKTTYGFTKPEIADAPTYRPHINGLPRTGGFKILKVQFELFCQMANNIINMEEMAAIAKDGNGKMILSCIHEGVNKSATLEIQITGSYEPFQDFRFDPAGAYKFLKPLTYEYIFVNLLGNKAIITTEENAGYLGIISGKN